MTRSAQVYRDGSKLVYCTGESPPQFPGVLFITLEGETPDTVSEAVRTVAQLRGLQDVEESTLSVQWKNALGLPEVEPVPTRQDTRRSSPQRGGRSATPSRTRRRSRDLGDLNMSEEHRAKSEGFLRFAPSFLGFTFYFEVGYRHEDG